jgi:hypothetical protein
MLLLKKYKALLDIIIVKILLKYAKNIVLSYLMILSIINVEIFQNFAIKIDVLIIGN